MSDHVTNVVLAVDPDGDTRFRPKCSCGWEGALQPDRDAANIAAFVHCERMRVTGTPNARTPNDPDNHT